MVKTHRLQGKKEEDPLLKVLQTHLRSLPEGPLSRFIMEMSIHLRVSSATDGHRALVEVAKEYNVDTVSIIARVKQQLAAKEIDNAEKKSAKKRASAKKSNTGKKAA